MTTTTMTTVMMTTRSSGTNYVLMVVADLCYEAKFKHIYHRNMRDKFWQKWSDVSMICHVFIIPVLIKIASVWLRLWIIPCIIKLNILFSPLVCKLAGYLQFLKKSETYGYGHKAGWLKHGTSGVFVFFFQDTSDDSRCEHSASFKNT